MSTASWLATAQRSDLFSLDLTEVPPGDYVVISQTDDPSGEGRFHTDTRRITVVD